MQVTIITIVIGAFGTVTKGLIKGPEDMEVGGRDLRKFAVTQTPVKEHLITLMWKTLISPHRSSPQIQKKNDQTKRQKNDWNGTF